MTSFQSKKERYRCVALISSQSSGSPMWHDEEGCHLVNYATNFKSLISLLLWTQPLNESPTQHLLEKELFPSCSLISHITICIVEKVVWSCSSTLFRKWIASSFLKKIKNKIIWWYQAYCIACTLAKVIMTYGAVSCQIF